MLFSVQNFVLLTKPTFDKFITNFRRVFSQEITQFNRNLPQLV